MKNCPTCKREFTKMADYAEVIVSKFEWGPFSPAGSLKLNEPVEYNRMFEPIKSKETIFEDLTSFEEYQNYVGKLDELQISCQERTLLTGEVIPPFPPDKLFKWAYRLPMLPGETNPALGQYYIGMSEAILGICDIIVCVPGPNMGSAGGATLLTAGKIASIHYDGVVGEQ